MVFANDKTNNKSERFRQKEMLADKIVSFVYLIAEKDCREIALASVWQENDDVLARKLRTLS